jgi:hypothetical protein
MNLIRSSCIVMLFALSLPPATAAPAASGPGDTETHAARQASEPAPAPGPAPALSARFRLATPATLEQMRGGTDSITINTQLRGTTDGNSATNVVTGSNMIQTGSFANAAGVPVVIQNSGANVLIQNATVVNLQFQ